MNLTSEEQALLRGELGEGAKLAMKILVGLGEAFGAEKMAPISRAHVALSNQDADLWFAEKLLEAGARCRVPPTINPGFCRDFFRSAGLVSEPDLAQMDRTHRAYQALGARLSFSCTPYLLDNIPRFGEITAFSESSATPFVNSVWGARTNRESSQSALCAAVAGRTPVYGFLLDENRLGQAVVEVTAEMRDDFDYSLLGWLTPKLAPGLVPVFTGLPASTGPEALTNLGAELNTAGAVPMFHILGLTPEAPTLDQALGGRPPQKTVSVSRADLEEMKKNLFEPAGPIDFVMFGCPHHTLDQVRQAAELVDGRTLRAELWILTSCYTLEMAERMGLGEKIRRARGRIVPDTCVDQPVWKHLEGRKGATDSPKCAYYTKRRGLRFVLGSLEQCVRAALTGEMK
ncbi:MAG: aconitase X catalytic domain-containing protein [Pseudomonadota bacterium]